MELTDRQKQILRAIVDIYVSTAEPVGSKAIAALPDVCYSSATIRNEMADLTQMGLLEQPHTSAGRIPSPAGYRLYIDELMQDYRLSLDETKSLNEALELKSQEFDKMMSQVGKLVSKMTDLPAYTVATRRNEAVTKHFDLIMAGPGSIILVLMLSDDQVRNKLIKLPVAVTEADLKLLAAVLNASMTDLTAEQINAELLEKITRTAGAASALVPLVIDFTLECLRQQHGDVHLTGQMRLLGQPEYKDAAEKAQEVFETLDEDMISNLPAVLPKDGPVQFLVGPENVAKELKDTSVVMMRFDIGEGMQGTIGVVGPTRMDYAKITAKLGYFAENLGKMFQKGGAATQPALTDGTDASNK
ncbi:MAG: heat-inducible transcription repressor HrcA [Oscillospiraceae bacterium]|nr:heat-inducible transcription repressor HrcA [Oscillospiraceae bacterium]